MWHQRRMAPIATALVLALSAGCATMYSDHGYVPTDRALSRIEIGDSQAEVAETVGRPSTTGLREDTGWYYVKSRYREFALRPRQEIDREVVAISFTEAGTVANIERFGLEEGNVVPLSRRVTDDAAEGTGFLRQLLGNIGRFDPAQFAGPQ